MIEIQDHGPLIETVKIRIASISIECTHGPFLGGNDESQSSLLAIIASNIKESEPPRLGTQINVSSIKIKKRI